jgi:dTDP-4-amino-4,6-dideoxygalactose transaminase
MNDIVIPSVEKAVEKAPPARTPIAGARPYFPEEDIPGILAGIAEVLRGGRLILGPKTRALEAAWSKRVGTKHAVALSSCTAALEITMRHIGVRGREVIIPTNTFVATANAAVSAGAKVVFADLDPDDYNLDASDALARITPETAAIVLVHIAGFLSKDIGRIRDVCKVRRIALIEDCAHAHGATIDGREAGSLTDAGCFSLYPTKVLTCGVGGVLTTDDDALAEIARSLRHHGQGASLEEIVHAGNDWMMDEMRAVVALSQLGRLDQFLERRRAIAAHYDALLADDKRFTLPRLAPGSKAAYYKYPVLLPEGIDRDAVRRELQETHQIEAGALYSPPCHLMPVFRESLGTGPGSLPRAESVLARQICLPMHALVTIEDAERSVQALGETLRRLA